MRIVILRGPDRYLMSTYTRKLSEALRAEHGEIGIFNYDGAFVEAAVVLDELRSFGLLSTHKLVIVDNADQFLAAKDDEETQPKGRGRTRTTRELMESYAAAPCDEATLLMRAETWRPGRLDKAVAKVGTIVKCDTPRPAQAIGWCRGRCQKEHGCEISAQAAEMLVERIGLDLQRLDSELGKLAAYVGEGGTIGPDEVRLMSGLSREEEAWAIQSTLVTGRPGDAVAKLRELLAVPQKRDQLVTWSLTDLLRKLHASSQLLRQGASPGEVAKQVRLWGDTRAPVLGLARQLEPKQCARLLQQAIEADRAAKSGVGNAPRNLEALVLEIVDTFRRA